MISPQRNPQLSPTSLGSLGSSSRVEETLRVSREEDTLHAEGHAFTYPGEGRAGSGLALHVSGR